MEQLGNYYQHLSLTLEVILKVAQVTLALVMVLMVVFKMVQANFFMDLILMVLHL